MSFNTKTEEYYKKFIELQEKLRKSEEERLKLEMKFNEMLRVTREEEQMHYRKLRSQYKRFLEEDRRRQDRNERIMRTLERIENRVAMLIAKTERFKLLRQQYQTFLDRIYRANQSKNAEAASNTPKEKQSEKPQPVDQNSDIVQSYIQNLSSQKLKDLLKKEEDSRKRLPFSVKTTPEETAKNPDDYGIFGEGQAGPIYANSIADDIMDSIYSRHNRLKDDHRQVPPRELNNNLNSEHYERTKDFGLPSTKLGDFSGFERKHRESMTTQETEDSETDDSPESQISSKASPMQFNSKSNNAFLSKTQKGQENQDYQNILSGIPGKPTEYSRYQEMNNDSKVSTLQEVPKLQNIDDKTSHVQELEPQKYKNVPLITNKAINMPNTTRSLIQKPILKEESNEFVPQKLPEIVVESTEQNVEHADQLQDISKINNIPNINRSFDERSIIKEETNEVVSQKYDEEIAKPISQQDVGEFIISTDNPKQETLIDQQPMKDAQSRKQGEVEIPTIIDEQKENSRNTESKIFEPLLANKVDDNWDKLQEFKEDIEYRQPEEECVSTEEHLQTYETEQVSYSKDEQPIREESAQGILYQQQKKYDDEKPQVIDSPINQDNQREVTYDDNDKSLQQHDKNSVSVVYDQQKQPSYEENSEIIQQYDEQGHPLQLQEFSEDDQFQHYDPNGQLEQQFDENGQPLDLSGYDGGQYLQQYDESGQPIQYDESGQFIQQYDENGQPLQQYDASGQPFQQYDATGQLLQQYDATGQPNQQYDESGQPFAQYDENGQFIGQYDEQNQLVQQYDQHGQIVQQYDSSGQLIQQYDENPLQYQYDENGQIVEQYDLGGGQQYDEQPQIQPSESAQQFYDQPSYEEKLEQNENRQQYVEETHPEQVTEEQPVDLAVEQNVPTTNMTKPSNVMEMLDTDTESAKQDTKISNDSDFDFSNA